MVVVPPVRTPLQAVAVLLTLWIVLLILNIFLLKTEINTTINLFLIVCIAITIIVLVSGIIYVKKR